MATKDSDGLPMYIEEDEEEAAAAKQKRRQQSQKPPFKEIITPEEKARREFNCAMMDKLYEVDPKTGSGYYTQVWFVNFFTFNLDDETQYGPMRFTDSLIGDDHKLTDSLNVLCLKIRSSDVGYPINVYGTVIVRDRLDMKCNYIFKRDRNNCQLVRSEGESLILTGPTRGIVLRTDAYFEINLKIKQDRESEDKQFSKTLIDVDSVTIDYKVKTQTTVCWLSEVDLMFSYLKKALEGTIEIRILSGSSSFHGRVTVCTTDIPGHILLYDSDVHGANTMGNDRVLKLLRRVVSVSVDQMLIFHIYPHSGDLNPGIFEFTPRINGADKVEITCGGHRMQVKVTWSILSARRGSLLSEKKTII